MRFAFVGKVIADATTFWRIGYGVDDDGEVRSGHEIYYSIRIMEMYGLRDFWIRKSGGVWKRVGMGWYVCACVRSRVGFE